ncbi:hypothetical protein KIW84_010653 [Lathyrus oleraceus]|uniref:Uncharacterized protein n=1 Tax=Pisum sativum TaxID=3888 RepID=A0A9D4YMR8_PEA|nr:hypothetical protein KIW84_010653 [Pisum sativum]
MASISMAVAPSCIKSTCGKGEWFHYKSVACIQEEDCHIENGHSYREAKMASISMAVALSCIKIFSGEGESFGYTLVACIQEEYYHNGGGDSYKERDDDDDGDYDYAPAA